MAYFVRISILKFVHIFTLGYQMIFVENLLPTHLATSMNKQHRETEYLKNKRMHLIVHWLWVIMSLKVNVVFWQRDNMVKKDKFFWRMC